MENNILVSKQTISKIQKLLKDVDQKLFEQIILKKRFLNINEASAYLKISQSTLYKLTSTGKLEFYKPSGKLIYFERETLDNWITSNKSFGITRLNKEEDIAKRWAEENFKTSKL